jgi:HAD superfamily hydrolase (TIGR01509 family)
MSGPEVDGPSVVVFDVGNVLLRWDPRFLYRKLFADEARMEWFLREVWTHEWNLARDRGESFADGIAELVARHPDLADEIRAYDERWQETIPHAIEGSVEILQGLREAGVPLYAITNFSREKWAESRVRFPFLDDFLGVVVSAHERLVKPDPAIYRLFLERYRLEAPDCVFIDDSDKNVDGARAVGMHAVHFHDPGQLRTDLTALGFPV